jgi:hypothetical protein
LTKNHPFQPFVDKPILCTKDDDAGDDQSFWVGHALIYHTHITNTLTQFSVEQYHTLLGALGRIFHQPNVIVFCMAHMGTLWFTIP